MQARARRTERLEVELAGTIQVVPGQELLDLLRCELGVHQLQVALKLIHRQEAPVAGVPHVEGLLELPPCLIPAHVVQAEQRLYHDADLVVSEVDSTHALDDRPGAPEFRRPQLRGRAHVAQQVDTGCRVAHRVEHVHGPPLLGAVATYHVRAIARLMFGPSFWRGWNRTDEAAWLAHVSNHTYNRHNGQLAPFRAKVK